VPVLPSQYHSTFKELYDNAPAVSYEVVEEIFKREFDGKLPSDIFASFSEEPIASASIAQVHKAVLKDGTHVAVKIQKPEIAVQMGWDMFCYRVILFVFEGLFDLPLYWSADYIEKHLRQEVDFVREARNSERCMRHIQEMPSLQKRIYVPKINWEYTSERILTAEWIDGTRFTDTEKIKNSPFPITDIMTAMVDVFSDVRFRNFNNFLIKV
jgi:aarF domain-containing kinase